jgi:MtN3 and saliva related transmembrane protein
MSETGIQWVGIAAGVLTSVALLPQVIKIQREKKANDISISYLATLFSGLCLWVVYGFLRQDIPVIATNIFSMIVSVVTIVLGLKYKRSGWG